MAAGRDHTFYSVLGIPEDCAADAMRAAYLRLALKYHPDRNPGDTVSEEKFKRVSQAYAVLRDPAARNRYDKLLAKKRGKIRLKTPPKGAARTAGQRPSPGAGPPPRAGASGPEKAGSAGNAGPGGARGPDSGGGAQGASPKPKAARAKPQGSDADFRSTGSYDAFGRPRSPFESPRGQGGPSSPGPGPAAGTAPKPGATGNTGRGGAAGQDGKAEKGAGDFKAAGAGKGAGDGKSAREAQGPRTAGGDRADKGRKEDNADKGKREEQAQDGSKAADAAPEKPVREDPEDIILTFFTTPDGKVSLKKIKEELTKSGLGAQSPVLDHLNEKPAPRPFWSGLKSAAAQGLRKIKRKILANPLAPDGRSGLSEQDLIFALALSPEAALSGTTVEVQYYQDGIDRKLAVRVPPKTRDGARLRLAGQGNLKPDGKTRGDLLLNLTVPGKDF